MGIYLRRCSALAAQSIKHKVYRYAGWKQTNPWCRWGDIFKQSPRYKRLWKFVVLHGISRQPIVGTCHPAPTLLSIFLLCMLLAEHTQTYCSEREEERRRKGEWGGEKRCWYSVIEGQPCHSWPAGDRGYNVFHFLSAILGLTACRVPGLTDLTESCHPLPTL